MNASIFVLIISFLTLCSVIFLLYKLKDKNIQKENESSLLETKINSFSEEIKKINDELISVTTPINELNRFLGGNVTTGRLGEWNLESIVKEILPDGSYEFQANINPENQDRVDCAVKTADGITIPIDSKFYAGQYKPVSYTHLTLPTMDSV